MATEQWMAIQLHFLMTCNHNHLDERFPSSLPPLEQTMYLCSLWHWKIQGGVLDWFLLPLTSQAHQEWWTKISVPVFFSTSDLTWPCLAEVMTGKCGKSRQGDAVHSYLWPDAQPINWENTETAVPLLYIGSTAFWLSRGDCFQNQRRRWEFQAQDQWTQQRPVRYF